MVTPSVLVLTLALTVAPALAANAAPSTAVQVGNGETAVATMPPAPGSDVSAMPRTAAQRLYAVQPPLIFGGLVALALLTALVLAIRMIVAAYRHP